MTVPGQKLLQNSKYKLRYWYKFTLQDAWTTFLWNSTMLQEWNALQWAIVLTVTGSFTFIAIWLFFNAKYENRDKKWFKHIFSGKEWTALMKSIELSGQVNEFKEKQGSLWDARFFGNTASTRSGVEANALPSPRMLPGILEFKASGFFL
jgi:hypothetical protein